MLEFFEVECFHVRSLGSISANCMYKEDGLDSHEHRGSPRKPLRVKAALKIEGESANAVQTEDMNERGVGLLSSRPVAVRQQGQIAFNVFLDGNLQLVSATVVVAHCVLSGDGFKVGILFTSMSASSRLAISHFLGDSAAE